MSEVRKAQIKLNMAKAKEQHKTSIKSMTDRLKTVGSKPVTELNKYTLAKYQQDAAQNLVSRSMDQGSGIKGYATDKNRKKIINRVVGIGKAANKLTQKTNEANHLANISTSSDYDGDRKPGPTVQRALDANKGKSKATITKGIYKRIQKDRGIEYPRRKTNEENIDLMNEDGHTDVASARRKAVLILEDASQLYMKLKTMPEEAGLPSWWMNKMAVTAAYMDSMRNYLLVPSSDNPSMGTMPESYSMASSDTNSADKFKKKVIPQQVQEKKKKKKAKLVPMGPTSFGTGSYTDSGGGDASVGEENDAEKMKNIDKNMKVLRKMKPLKSMLGPEGPGMKKVRAKADAISSTDKAGRSSRSRLISKYGKNINFGK